MTVLPTLTPSPQKADVNLPSYERPEVSAAAPLQRLIRDLLGGTEAMHANARAYIHQWTDEAPETYRFRSTLEQLHEGLGRTVSAATGMLFSKPPAVEIPTQAAILETHLYNIDGQGNALPVFAKRFAESAIAYGHSLILVDHPAPPEGTTITAANEVSLNLRPVWRRYDRASIVSWRTATVDNLEQVVQLVLYEPTTNPLGAFGVGVAERYRVLQLLDANGQRAAVWTVWEVTDKGVAAPIAQGVYRDRSGAPLPMLPIAVGYAGRTDAPLTSRPPLAGVAFANLGHWQQASNLRFYREVAAFPQPTVAGQLLDSTGNATTMLPLGPLAGVHLATPEATYSWTELAGTSLDQVEKGVLAKEQAMAALGLSFLNRETRAAETAEAKRLDATAENSTLATAGEGIDDALNLAAEIHCAYLGIAKEQAFTVTVNKDFERITLDSSQIAAVAQLLTQGMPVRQAVEILHAGGIIIAPDRTALDLIILEWEAGAAASADASAMAREMQGQRLLPDAA
jgi:hypothetical protein